MFSGILTKKDSKLIYIDNKDKILYENFVDKLEEGQKINIFLDLADNDHSTAQLAKVHACIRELAKESGYTFNETKELIKEHAGLAGKSFSKCSKVELMLAIESCLQIGRDNFNLNL